MINNQKDIWYKTEIDRNPVADKFAANHIAKKKNLLEEHPVDRWNKKAVVWPDWPAGCYCGGIQRQAYL